MVYRNESLNEAIDKAESTEHVETLRLLIMDLADAVEHWQNLSYEAAAEVRRLRRENK